MSKQTPDNPQDTGQLIDLEGMLATAAAIEETGLRFLAVMEEIFEMLSQPWQDDPTQQDGECGEDCSQLKADIEAQLSLLEAEGFNPVGMFAVLDLIQQLERDYGQDGQPYRQVARSILDQWLLPNIISSTSLDMTLVELYVIVEANMPGQNKAVELLYIIWSQEGDRDKVFEILADSAYFIGGWTPSPQDIGYIGYRSFGGGGRGGIVADDYPAEDIEEFLEVWCRDNLGPQETVVNCKDRLRDTAELQSIIDSIENSPYERGVYFSSQLILTGSERRPYTGDLLSTIIEEFGHSQQEWLFESSSDPQQSGQTSYVEIRQHGPGRELQVKLYILYLNCTGEISISSEQINNLKDHICDPTFYGINENTPLPNDYGPPTNWPHPEGWLTQNDRPNHVLLCNTLNSFIDSGDCSGIFSLMGGGP